MHLGDANSACEGESEAGLEAGTWLGVEQHDSQPQSQAKVRQMRQEKPRFVGRMVEPQSQLELELLPAPTLPHPQQAVLPPPAPQLQPVHSAAPPPDTELAALDALMEDETHPIPQRGNALPGSTWTQSPNSATHEALQLAEQKVMAYH